MNKKEINQIEIMEKLLAKQIKQRQVAKLLNLSVRQIIRKLKTYRRHGAPSLIHKLRGKLGNRQLKPGLRDKILKLIEAKYPDFKPTLATEKLAEIDKLFINRETLRLAMIKNDIWKPRRQKIRHRAWRPRKECFGELVQFDGSQHNWFEDRAPKCCLLAFIDDATSHVVHTEFAKSEATLTVMQATKHYLLKYGRPLEIYADRGKVVKVNQNNPDDEFKTQYQRALNELGIKVSYALSPQAKGRVERLFGSFQDRLIKEMRLASISSIQQGNDFLKQYLSLHNQKFSVAPQEKTNLHRGLKEYELDKIMCIKKQRILKNDFTLRYCNQWYQLTKQQATIIRPKNIIEISEYPDRKMTMSIRRTHLNYIKLTTKPEPTKVANVVLTSIRQTKQKPWKPKVDHPWKKFVINPYKEQYQST